MSAAVSVLRRASDQGLLVWFLVVAVAVQTSVASEFFLTSVNLANFAGQLVPPGSRRWDRRRRCLPG